MRKIQLLTGNDGKGEYHAILANLFDKNPYGIGSTEKEALENLHIALDIAVTQAQNELTRVRDLLENYNDRL